MVKIFWKVAARFSRRLRLLGGGLVKLFLEELKYFWE